MKIRGKEVKVIQEYKDFIVVEFPAGYRECISRHELGEIKETKLEREPTLHRVTGLRV